MLYQRVGEALILANTDADTRLSLACGECRRQFCNHNLWMDEDIEKTKLPSLHPLIYNVSRM